MKVTELLTKLEDFLNLLKKHRDLWSKSLDRTLPDYPIMNNDELERQSESLNASLGQLRPYLKDFRRSWLMQSNATGITWDALDTSVGLGNVAQIKGPSLTNVIDVLNQFIGQARSMNPHDEIVLNANSKIIHESHSYIDQTRMKELEGISNNSFDLTKLLQLLKEININFSENCYFAVITLTRALLDHVAPIFECKAFAEVANNYAGTKSVKESMQHLEHSCRKIANQHLHCQIRKKEVLPNKTQVNFSNDIDTLLSEIVRILK